MNETVWHQLVSDIAGEDIERMVEACDVLYRECDETDLSRLLELLERDNFVVREAAAWPLATLGGPAVLPELFAAYQRGFDEGHDNDGFTTALIELVSLHPESSREKLLQLRTGQNLISQKYADWLLGFC